MMLYKTIKGSAESELIEKKSRFICTIIPITNRSECESILAAISKQYPGARHYCYAYLVKEDGIAEKYSDDGEPGGTAGQPILNVLKQNELLNVMAVVVRYFGGTLLGTGGLVRTYSRAVLQTLNSAEIITMEYSWKLKTTIDYSYYGAFQNKCQSMFNQIVDTVFADQVIIEGWLPIDKENNFTNVMNEITGRTAGIEYLQQDFVPKK